MLMEDAAGPIPEDLTALHESAHATVKAIEHLMPSSLVQLDFEKLAQIRVALREPVFRLVAHLRNLGAEGLEDFQEFQPRIQTAVSELADFTHGKTNFENAPGPGVAPQPGNVGHARLLVVDDNASNRQLLANQLHRMAYDVSTAGSGPEALKLLREGCFDVVLLDVQMPDLDGFQTLAILQRDEVLREIPVIMISATDEYESAIRCIEGGAEDYLIKPFDAVLLRARLKASLEKKMLRDQRRQRTLELETVNRDLRRMQDRLITQEKLASLGTLAAGIAHEIKNPLNFITNFAALSHELAADIRKSLGDGDFEDAKENLELLEQNLRKIEEHGKRADRVVRGMLVHSRKQSGKRDATDLNALVTECCHLAYHGLRSQDMTFNAAIETDLDNSIGQIYIFPQDMSRVFINLFANAFYSVHERRKRSGGEYNPTVWARTRAGETIEVRIRDNGLGIPADHLKKIFEPFYTTKPKDAGTGLGLSISQDIVFGEHGGEISVISREGEFAEFVVSLPVVTA